VQAHFEEQLCVFYELEERSTGVIFWCDERLKSGYES